MKSRGDGKRLWVGVLIALPSGAGVALSVLGGNTGSLVGVAISASLLPPAVNCGLLFAYSTLGRIFSRTGTIDFTSLNTMNESLASCPRYNHNDYRPLYSCNLTTEAAILACCSLLLTIVNIICIVIMALIILRIKEVVPLNQVNKDIAQFFHHDVRVARDYNKTIHEGEFDPRELSTSTVHRNHLAQSIVDRWKSFKSPGSSHAHQQTNQSLPTSPNLDLESARHIKGLVSDDIESRRKLFRLQSLAKEYHLDIFNTDDYELTNPESEEKVRLLVTDLIDMCREIPSVFVDLYRLQPFGTQSLSRDREQPTFYQEVIENLPPKWHQLYLDERQRHFLTAWSMPFDRTYATRPRPPNNYDRSASNPGGFNHHESLKKQNKKFRPRLARQNSEPESKKTQQAHDTELPVKGTRFRIAKPTTTAEMYGNESALI